MISSLLRRERTEPSAKQNWTIPGCLLAKVYQAELGPVPRPPTVGKAPQPIHELLNWRGPLSESPRVSPNIRVLPVPSALLTWGKVTQVRLTNTPTISGAASP